MLVLLTEEHHAKQPLLESRNIITTPNDCNYETFREMEWALEYARHNPNKLRPIVRVAGDGGSSDIAFGIGELVKEAGAYTVLLGGAYSAHATIWSMGERRFAYRTAILGLHSSRVSFNENVGYNESELLTHARNCKSADYSCALIFAGCCENKKYNARYWLNLITRHKDATHNIWGYDLLDMYQMAEPASLITELRRTEQIDDYLEGLSARQP